MIATIIEYILCYAGAFFLGFATALVVLYWAVSYEKSDTE